MHVDAHSPATLERRGWRGQCGTLCTSPCDLDVPRDGEYRVVTAMKSSSPFRLRSGGARVVLRVDDGTDRRVAGGILIGFGVVSTVVGLGSLLVGAAAGSGGFSFWPSENRGLFEFECASHCSRP